jgi:uncharacterized protein
MSPPSTARLVTSERLDLLDWKRRIFDLYREVRVEKDPASAWRRWCQTRDELIARHPQSPVDLAGRAAFRAEYFDYDPAARALAVVVPVEPEDGLIPMSRDDGSRFTHFADVEFELLGHELALGLCWLEAYGGGVFLCFTDETSGETSYGAGRYLLDTVKGADLGTMEGKLVLDFNFSFNPSCAYDTRWACPLAPAGNRLPIAVRAGERRPAAIAA